MDTLSFSKLQITLSMRYMKAFAEACRSQKGRDRLGCPWLNFNDLVDTYYRSLYQFAYSLAGNQHEASDLVQQTFFIYAHKGGGIREPEKIKTWLFTTLYREFLGVRRRGKKQSVQEPTYLEEFTAAPIDSKIIQSIDGGAAVAALKEIEEVYRVPLVLFFLQEYSYREISKILDIPIGTVMSRLSRGKKLLKEHFLKKKNDKQSS